MGPREQAKEEGTLAQAAARGSDILAGAGVAPDEARRDSALLARWVLGWDAADWLARSREQAPAAFADTYFALITRRAAQEPLAYLTGEREFFGRAFRVSPAVLIPRPETELLIEEALRCLRPRQAESPVSLHPLVVDLGTGSGCLAATIALECPSARIVATDVSAAALAVARENALRLGAAERIEFREGPWLAGLTDAIDLLVSNPPYVAERDRDHLPRTVVDFEPAEALFGGVDGLDAIRMICSRAPGWLAREGHLMLEIGQGQFEAVRALIDGTAALRFERASSDLQGISRVVVARRTE